MSMFCPGKFLGAFMISLSVYTPQVLPVHRHLGLSRDCLLVYSVSRGVQKRLRWICKQGKRLIPGTTNAFAQTIVDQHALRVIDR